MSQLPRNLLRAVRSLTGAVLLLSGAGALTLRAQTPPAPLTCADLAARYRIPVVRASARTEMRTRCAAELGQLVAEQLSAWLDEVPSDAARTELLRDALLSPSVALPAQATRLLDGQAASRSRIAAGFALLAHSGSTGSSATLSLAQLEERFAKLNGPVHGLWCKDSQFAGVFRHERSPRAFAADTMLADLVHRVLRSADADRFAKAMALCSTTLAIASIPERLEPTDLIIRYQCDNIWTARMADSMRGGWIQFGPQGAPGERNSSVAKRERLLRLPFAADLWVANRGRELLRVAHGHRSCRAARHRDRGEPIPSSIDTLAGWQWRASPIRPRSAPQPSR
jgi:hypothetical protein